MENSQIHTPIIPIKQIFYNTDTGTIVPWGNHHQDLDIDYKAIAVFSAYTRKHQIRMHKNSTGIRMVQSGRTRLSQGTRSQGGEIG